MVLQKAMFGNWKQTMINKLITHYKTHWSNNRPKPKNWVQRYPDIPDRNTDLAHDYELIPMLGLTLFVVLLGLACV